MSLSLQQVDFKSAFLNGKINREKYISLSPGVSGDRNNSVYQLKALYGLPTAPKCWYTTLNTFLLSIGFHIFEHEPCTFTLKKKENRLFVYIYR